jgi:hypothetical protein
MGMEYKCGCRCSMGHWFLCNEHLGLLLSLLEE